METKTGHGLCAGSHRRRFSFILIYLIGITQSKSRGAHPRLSYIFILFDSTTADIPAFHRLPHE